MVGTDRRLCMFASPTRDIQYQLSVSEDGVQALFLSPGCVEEVCRQLVDSVLGSIGAGVEAIEYHRQAHSNIEP